VAQGGKDDPQPGIAGLTAADILLVLCSLGPCVEAGGVLQVPMMEVPPRAWIEMLPVYEVDGRRVVFVPWGREC
jgi:hypothetical protein